MINLTRFVNLFNQHLSDLCEARGVTVPHVAEQPPNLSHPPHSQTSPTEAAAADASIVPSPSTPLSTDEQMNLAQPPTNFCL